MTTHISEPGLYRSTNKHVNMNPVDMAKLGGLDGIVEEALRKARLDKSPAHGRAGYNIHPQGFWETLAWVIAADETRLMQVLVVRDEARPWAKD